MRRLFLSGCCVLAVFIVIAAALLYYPPLADPYPPMSSKPFFSDELAADRLCINTANCADLEALPGIGPVRARAIVAYREEMGEYLATRQLLRVDGMTRVLLKQIEPYICTN